MPPRLNWPTRLETQEDLNTALGYLARRDKPLARALERLGPPDLRRSEPGFAAIVGSILGQQVSAVAARAIRGKLIARVGTLTAPAILALSVEELRSCGLSGQKTRYVTALATAVQNGLDIDGLADQPDETIITTLTALPGIGRWTAEIYLLFALGRADVWPADDLALAVAAGHILRQKDRPKGRAAREIAGRWAPARGAMAHFLWHYYHDLTARDAVLSDKPTTKSPSAAEADPA
jgi:DNA-3-methyladenine glycosylase II